MNFISSLGSTILSNLDIVAAGISLLLVVEIGTRWDSDRPSVSQLPEGLWTWLVIGAIVGARIGGIIPTLSIYVHHPLDVLPINEGMSLYGGTGGGLAVLTVYSLSRRQVLTALTDAFAAALLIGIAFYRLSCLAYGFCGGKAASFPLGIPLPGYVGTHYPSSLLEGLFAVLLVLVLFRMMQGTLKPGVVTGLFLVFYPLVRFALDFTRYSTGPWNWGDRIVSLVAMVFGMTILTVLKFKSRRVSAETAGDVSQKAHHLL